MKDLKKFLRKLLKNKKAMFIIVLCVILLICLLIMRSVFFPGHGSNYGNRLDGIRKISFTDKDKNSIIDSIKKNDKVSDAKMNVHGKIINIIFNVNEDVSIDDAKAIAGASLEKFSDKVKGFYDIQFLVSKNDEKGEEVQIQNDDGTTSTEIRKQFPIMGYKNSNKDNIVW